MSRSLSEIQNSLLIFLNKTAQNVSTVKRTVSCNKDIVTYKMETRMNSIIITIM